MKILKSRRNPAQASAGLLEKNANRLGASSAWRALAASGILAGAGLLAGGNAALADTPCTTLGTTVTCTGDQSSGVSQSDPTEVLNVNNLYLPIFPTSGTSGIFFQSTGPITVNSDTTGWLGGVIPTIITEQAPGIDLESTGGSVTLDHTGAILAIESEGVRVISVGGVDLDIDGPISSGDAGIFVDNQVGGTQTSVTHYGNILSLGGPGIDVTTSSTPLDINNTGYIETFGDGISAVNTSDDPTHGTTVYQNGGILAGGRGIFAKSDDGDVLVDSEGAIFAGGKGIEALALTGDAEIQHDGNVTSVNAGGLEVVASDGDAKVSGSGRVISYGDGVFAQATGVYGDGTATVDWDGAITSETGKGVYAYSANDAVDVKQYGAIDSYGDGIFAQSLSEQSVTVDHTGDIDTSRGAGDAYGNGIYAYSSSGAVKVTMSDGDINSAGDGIFAQNKGAESVEVNMTGDIDADGMGVYAYSSSGAVTVNQYGDIESNGAGIFAQNYGSEAVTVDHTGNITSTGGDGIYTYSATGPIKVTMSDGDISAAGNGIFAQNYGPGSVEVEFTGDITQAGLRGIFASSAGGNISVKQYGDINSVDDAIFAKTTDSGTVTIDHTGDITSTSGKGIYAYTVEGAVDVTSKDGDISAAEEGIYAHNAGAGAVTVDMTGDILQSTVGIDAGSGTGKLTVLMTGDITSSGRGIFADSTGGEVLVNQYGEINSGGDGIFARTLSGQSVTVDHTGDITSTDARGIYAYSSSGAVKVTMSDGDITSDSDAIYAESKGAGAVEVDFTGNVTQAGGRGVYAYSSTGPVTVNQYGSINANSDGIYAASYGSEAVRVGHTGNITSTYSNGIFAYSATGPVKVTMSDGDISAANGDGIYAQNLGSSSVEVEFTGDILSAGDRGVHAGSATGNVSVKQYGEINSVGTGIYAVTADSGTVTVDHTGDITSTSGKGIYAYTVEGTVDVTSKDGDITANQEGIYARNVGAGAVTVDMTGDILQSTVGIDAGSGTGKLTVLMTGDITSSGRGVYANSSGGEVLVNHYGEINSGGDGIFARTTSAESVTVDHTGDITSTGGRGIDAYSSSGDVKVTMSDGDISANTDGIFARNLGTGDVEVDFTGNVTHAGGVGVYAYSSNGKVTIKQYGSINSVGDSIYAVNTDQEDILVDHTGNLTSTAGHGIYATSTNGEVKVTMASGNISAAKSGIFVSTTADEDAIVEFTGDITQAGEYGVYAYSSSGDVSVKQYGAINSTMDGIYAATVGSRDVTVDHTGDIDSSAGDGIQAYSGDGEIKVTHDEGTITAAQDGIHVRTWGKQTVTVGENGKVIGADNYTGVYFEQGTTNKLVNYGTVENAGGINDMAVQATFGDTVIDNYGTMSGNVDLYIWNNAFNNYSGALFNMGSIVDLGAYDDNVLSNSGTVSPGGVDNVMTTALTGSFTNNSDGTMLFDVDMDNSTVDRIDATNLASLDGDLKLNFVSLDATPTDYIIMTASNVTTQNLSLVNPLVVGSITYENSDTEVHLNIDSFDFAPSGISGNAVDIGNFISASINAGSNGLDPLALALLNLPTIGDVQDALTQLSPNVYMSQQIAALNGSIGFADKLLSCRVADGAYAFGAEGQCAWARGGYRAQSFDGKDSTGFDASGFDFSAGAQVNGGGDWRFGAALGVTTSNIDGDNNASSDGTSFQAGAVAKYAPGPYLFAAAVSGSWGSYDTTRHVDFPGFSDKLEGDPDVYSLNARLRAAFTVEQNNMYLRPMVDMNATYVHTSAFTESGGVAAISVDSNSETVFSVSPAIEIGGQTVAGNGALLRPYLRGGVSFFSQDNIDLSGRFAADTAGIDSFTVTTAMDDMLWNVSAGLDVLSMDGKTLQLFYQGNFGDKTTDNSGGVKFSVNF